MQAVILAAGRGNRMRPLTDETHKALLQVGPMTVLGRVMNELTAADLAAINVVTGYRAEDVETYLLENYKEAPLRFIRNERYAESDNVVSLALALREVEPGHDLILIECDVMLAEGLLRHLCRAGLGNVALLDQYCSRLDGTVVSVRNGRVWQVFPPSAQHDGFDFQGMFKTLNVYRFSAEFLHQTLKPLVTARAEQVDASSYYEAVLATLADLESFDIEAVMVDRHNWAEIDDPLDLLEARFRFAPSERAAILDTNMGGTWDFDYLDFGHIRNCYFPTAAIRRSLSDALPDLLSSYSSAHAVVNSKLSWLLDCVPARIVALNGASQAFPILSDLWKNKAVAIPSPTFGEYARMFPGAATYPDPPGIDLDHLDRLAGQVDILVVVNPNNPTGSTVSSRWLYELTERHPETLLLVDESFVDFCGEPSIRFELERRPRNNVLVLTSLSKSLGVPGARLGHVYSCDSQMVAAISGALPIWNLGSLAEHLLELTIRARTDLTASLLRTRCDREDLRSGLLGLNGIRTVHPSGGNFLLVDLHGGPDAATAARSWLLAKHSIEVKVVTGRFDDGIPRLRIAVRTPDDNARLLCALEALFATSPSGAPAVPLSARSRTP